MSDQSIPVYFEPANRTASASFGDNLFQLARQHSVHLDSACGGNGSCGLCRVKVISDSPRIPRSKSSHRRDAAGGPAKPIEPGDCYLACTVELTGPVHVRAEPVGGGASRVHRPKLVGMGLPVPSQLRESTTQLRVSAFLDPDSAFSLRIDTRRGQIVEQEPISPQSQTLGVTATLDSGHSAKLHAEQLAALVGLNDSAPVAASLCLLGVYSHQRPKGTAVACLDGSGQLLLRDSDGWKLQPLNLNPELFDNLVDPAHPGAVVGIEFVPASARPILHTSGGKFPSGTSFGGLWDIAGAALTAGRLTADGEVKPSRFRTETDAGVVFRICGPELTAVSPHGQIWSPDKPVEVPEQQLKALIASVREIGALVRRWSATGRLIVAGGRGFSPASTSIAALPWGDLSGLEDVGDSIGLGAALAGLRAASVQS